jgi:hypothetical protein
MMKSPNISVLNTPSNEASAGASFRNPADLLGLLRSTQTNQQTRQTPPTSQSRPVSAADLVAGFGRRPSSIGSITSPSIAAPSASRPDLRGEAAATSSTNPQDFLLKLLNSQAKTETFSPNKQTEYFSKTTVAIEPVIYTPTIEGGLSGKPLNSTLAENIPFTEKSNETTQVSSRSLFTYSDPFNQIPPASSKSQNTSALSSSSKETEIPLPKKDIVKESISSSATPQQTP